MHRSLTTPATARAARLRARRAERSLARAQRSRLRAELASYRTPAERAELAAMLARHTPEQVADLEARLR
jgi:hypothetical protein